MSRLTQLLVLFFTLCVSTLSFVVGEEEPTVPSETEAPARPRVKISPDAYPYGKPKEATGVRCSRRTEGEMGPMPTCLNEARSH